MKEVYTNGCQSFLSANVGTSDTTFNVIGGNWPTTGQFTVLVDTEYMVVTNVAGQSPSTLTVIRAQEGSIATNHNQGALIFVNLTDGSLRRLSRQSINGVNVSARREINFIGANVSIVDNSTTDSADITILSGGLGYTAPPQTGWTLIQGTGNTGTFTTDSNGVNLLEAGVVTGYNENVKFLYRALPAIPFAITSSVLLNPPAGNANTNYGMMLGESSTGKLQAMGYAFSTSNGLQQNAWCWTNSNNFNQNPKSINLATPYLTYQQISYDGTNYTMSYSNDGINFVPFFTANKGSFFTSAPDQIGFYINAQNGTGVGSARLIHWKQT